MLITLVLLDSFGDAIILFLSICIYLFIYFVYTIVYILVYKVISKQRDSLDIAANSKLMIARRKNGTNRKKLASQSYDLEISCSRRDKGVEV